MASPEMKKATRRRLDWFASCLPARAKKLDDLGALPLRQEGRVNAENHIWNDGERQPHRGSSRLLWGTLGEEQSASNKEAANHCPEKDDVAHTISSVELDLTIAHSLFL